MSAIPAIQTASSGLKSTQKLKKDFHQLHKSHIQRDVGFGMGNLKSMGIPSRLRERTFVFISSQMTNISTLCSRDANHLMDQARDGSVSRLQHSLLTDSQGQEFKKLSV